MSDEIMEALDSGTSSESEADSVKSPMKGCESPSPSPRKFKIASPVTNENSNSSSDLPLSLFVQKKRTQLAILSEADTESSTSTTTTEQNVKASNVLESMDENSSSSDIPLIKLTANRSKYHPKPELQVAKSNISIPLDESSCSSDVPLSKFVVSAAQHKNSDEKKENNNLQKNLAVNRSKKSKSMLQVISDNSDTSPVEQSDSDSNSSIVEAREISKSNTKNGKSIKNKKLSEEKGLKRKRSGEADSEQLQAKTKRKLNIISDSSSDDAVEKKCTTPKPASNKKKLSVANTNKKETLPASTKKNETLSASAKKNKTLPASAKKKETLPVSTKKNETLLASAKKNKTLPTSAKKNKTLPVSTKKNDTLLVSDRKNETLPASTMKNETVPATITTKSSPTMDEKKSGPASSKKNLRVQNDVTISPTKNSDSTDSQCSSSKSIDVKKTKKLNKIGILEKLDNSSSSSSEDSETEDTANVENNIASQPSSTSESDRDSDIILSSFKGKNKVLQQKKSNGTMKTESISDSDEPVPSKKKERKASPSIVDELPGDSSSEPSSGEESDNVSPKKEKVTDKDERTSKQETTKEKKKPGDNPRIVRLQRYLKEAGIRVQNYKTLWQDCKSDKARVQKLMELLHERGLKGKPSVSECRKLKKKFEREKEVSELSTSNIITSNGRSRRGVTSLFATRHNPSSTSGEKEETSPKKSPEFKKMFGRLKAIVDSEDSD